MLWTLTPPEETADEYRSRGIDLGRARAGAIGASYITEESDTDGVYTDYDILTGTRAPPLAWFVIPL